MNKELSRRNFMQLMGAAAAFSALPGIARAGVSMNVLRQDVVTISFAGWGQPAEQEGVVAAIEKFQEENPGIQVEWRHTPDTDTEVDSLRLLSIPHIYSWESACSYQGYGLAQLAVYQWREYFYKKYGFIVDNKAVGKEMRAVWKYGSAKTFPECVKLATGNKLSPEAYLKQITASADTVLKTAKQKIPIAQRRIS